jgi:hypothetical protein
MKAANIWAAGLALLLSASAAQAQGPGGSRGGGRGGGSTSLLRIPEVQKELKIDEAQKDLIDQVNQEMDGKRRQMFESSQNLSREERGRLFQSPEMQAKFQALGQETEKKIAEILDKKQMARLKQLSIQQAGTSALYRKEVQDELKFTADQRTKLQAQEEAQRDAFRQAFQGFQPGQQMTDAERAEIRKRFDDMRIQNEAKLMGILTEAQKKQFTAMQGAPFKFPERRFGPGGPRRERQQ